MEPRELVIKYLQDAEAAERNFEDTLAGFAKTGEQHTVKHMFEAASRKAKTQHERLAARLHALGGDTSGAKSALAHVLSFTPTLAQLGHEGAEKNTQHLIITFAAAAAEMAMYEALATVAAAARDTETERLARQLQTEEREDYDQVWQVLRDSALTSFQTVLARHN